MNAVVSITQTPRRSYDLVATIWLRGFVDFCRNCLEAGGCLVGRLIHALLSLIPYTFDRSPDRKLSLRRGKIRLRADDGVGHRIIDSLKALPRDPQFLSPGLCSLPGWDRFGPLDPFDPDASDTHGDARAQRA